MALKNFSNLKIILVEPSGPINIGSIARLCSNYKVHELRIISPKCNIHSLDAKKMALKGIKYINECKIYDSLKESIYDCDLVLASCGRIDYAKDIKPDSIERISSWLKGFKKIENLAIIFGREDRGLTNNELLMAQKIFTIKTDKNFPSLNLSHAVSIVLYELNKYLANEDIKPLEDLKLATSKQIEDTFFDMEKLLLKVGYLFPHTSNARICKFKKYIHEKEASEHELNTLRGVIHQINWALQNKTKDL